jgi:hypothetical protein
LTPTASGTRFTRDIRYRGANLLFAFANALNVRDVMEKDSAAAVANVKRHVEAAPPS